MTSKADATETFQTTCSGGGPVLAVPAEIAAAWRGTAPPIGAEVPPGWTWGDRGGPVCDYDRACDSCKDSVVLAGSALGWLEVGDGRALVLDGELATVWIPEDSGGVIARGDVTEDSQTRNLIPESGWTPYAVQLTLRSGRLFLFDSAFDGNADPAEITADDGVAVATMTPGTYALTHASSRGNDFIRLTRAAD